MIQKAIVIA